MDIHCVLCEVGTNFFMVFVKDSLEGVVLKGWYNFTLLLYYTKLFTNIILLSLLYFAPTCYENFNYICIMSYK